MSPVSQVNDRPGQLPRESTGFVGRASELAALGTLVGRARLVTVTGPGGVGKTRLAVRAAAAAGERYANGVAFVGLSGIRDPGLLPQAVVSALGLSQQDSRDPADMITSYLRERELLLILDTCEHLLDAAALFSEALAESAPGVTILATSRQPLDVHGENLYPLSPLSVPARGTPAAARDAGDAVDLFAQRAAEAVPGFRVTGENSGQIVRLCRQLDGIPLAIELAAVRLREFDLGELARRLDHRLALLSGRDHAADTRHQTLRDAIGWSYDLCGRPDQVLWQRLSVFAGPFTAQAAREVCGGGALPRDEVPGALVSLVDKSVLARDHSAAVPCYRMLDTLREYGAERLEKTGTAGQVRARLTAYYGRLAEELNSDPFNGQLDKYRVLRAQHSNVMTSLEYGLSVPGQEHTATDVLSSLYWFVEISGNFQESKYHLDKTLDRLDGPSPGRAHATALLSLIRAAEGDPDGVAGCEEALAMAAGLGDQRTRARCQLYYSQALLAAGRLPETIEAAKAAREMLAEAGDPTADVAFLYLGLAFLLSGDLEASYESAAAGLRRMPADGRERWLSSFLYTLSALALSLQGQHKPAEEMLRTALSMRQDLGDPMGAGFCLGLLGYVAAQQGRLEEAAWLMGITAPVWETLGTEPFTGVPGLAELIGEAGKSSRAALGPGTWDDVYNRAAAHPMQDAIALAADPSQLARALTAGPA